MAIFALTGTAVTINGVNLSDHIKSATLKYEADELDTTAFGSTTKTRIAGLLDWSLDVEFNQDYAASNVDATLFPLVGAAPFTVTIKATSGATSSTNPQYSGSAIISSYSPSGGKIGELASTQATFKAAGALSRLTS